MGQAGDGGVDGVVPADPLGLDRVYIQAKRYDASRSAPIRDVHDFLGALESKRAKRGIFITTGSGGGVAHRERLAAILARTYGAPKSRSVWAAWWA